MSGPSTKYIAIVTFEIENVMKDDQSHVRERTSPSPCRTSARKLRCSSRSIAEGRRMPTRQIALATKVSASIVKIGPKPTKTTRAPAVTGPKIWIAFCDMLISAFASCRRSGLTMVFTSPVEAGPKKALAPPRTNDATIRCQSATESVKKASASSACVPARTRSAAIITSWRGRRSDQTPPTRMKITRAPNIAAKTSPRSAAEPVRSSTANVSASGTSASPSAEIAWPSQSSLNCRSLSASKLASNPLTRGVSHVRRPGPTNDETV